MAAAPTAPPPSDTSETAYAAVYGRNAALSAAELFALSETNGFTVKALNRYAVGLSAGFDLPLADRLGGTTKVIQLEPAAAPSAEAAIHALAGNVARPHSGKLSFGISSYGSVPATPLTGLMKKLLEKRGIKCRYMAKRAVKAGRATEADEISAVQVKHNRLLRKGHDWCLFETANGWRYGRTVWVYDFEGFARRDYDKPVADAKRGMLPPQLSRVMLNLGTQGREAAVCDPFCGIGGLLLESLTLDHATYGSDLEQAAVDGAERNLEWLGKTSREPLPAWELSVHDATASLPPEIPAATIVTEGYLGDPLRQSSSEHDIREQAARVGEVLKGFFKTARSSTKAGDRLVITLPAWKLPNAGPHTNHDALLRLEPIAEFERLGYTVIRPLPQDFPVPGVTERGSIEVARSKQRVIHELFIFQRTT